MLLKHITQFSLYAMAAYGGASWAVEEIGTRSHAAYTLLNTIPTEKSNNLVYINTQHVLTTPLAFPHIQRGALEQGKRYLFDFSMLDARQKIKAQQLIKTHLGVSFSTDWLLVSPYKEGLIYTPIQKTNDPILQTALKREVKPARKMLRATEDISLPHVAFYLDVSQLIRSSNNDACAFPSSPVHNLGLLDFCENAHISLVYRVNTMRSLSNGSLGAAIPDAKLVRISLDDASGGAGIQLNQNIKTQTTSHPLGNWPDGWSYSYVTSAIAKDYMFTISAQDIKDGSSPENNVSILNTFPSSNLNTNYKHKDVSGFEIGVTAGVEASKDSAKAKLEPKYSYKQERTLEYDTQDYRVVRSTPDARTIRFTWERDQYATASSFLSKTTSTIWDASAPPIDTSKIKPVSYTGFTPHFDVIYKAPVNTKGKTKFVVSSSVNLWPVVAAAYQHYYVFASHVSYQAKEEWQQTRRITAETTFEVDWNHPVFTGGRPVNLQLAGFNDQCIAYGEQGKVEIQTCNLNSVAQSFIYDEYGRYASVQHSEQCLDGTNLTDFQACNANLSQRWSWKENTETLENKYLTHYFLAHNTENKRLSLAPQGTNNVSVRTITKFTNLFSQ